MTKEDAKPQIRFKGFSDSWIQRKLGEVAPLRGGYAFKSIKYTNNGIPIIRISNILVDGTIGEEFVYYQRQVNDENFSLRDGAILLAMSGATTGKVSILNCKNRDKYYQNQRVGYFTKKKEFNYNFISDIVRSQYFMNQLTDVLVAGAQPNVAAKDIDDFEFMFPLQKDEQKQIGIFFSSFDNIIKLYQRKYDQLCNIKKAMLEKMFPKEGATIPAIRFKGFTEDWEKRKFENIATRSSIISSKSSLPRVEYEDIISGTGQLNKDIFMKESAKSGIFFNKGDILYGKLRPYLHNWLLPLFSGLAVGDFWVLQPQKINSNFLYRLIQSQQFDEVANQSIGTKMPRADWKLVSKTEFLIPQSKDEQAVIGTYFENLDNLLTLCQRKLEKLKNLKKAMLEKMFV